MGYQINYQNGYVKTAISKKKSKPKIVIWLFAIIIISVVFYSFVPKIKNKFTAFALNANKTPFSSFVGSVQNGGTLGQAFEVFCREIITNADIS